MDLVRLTQASCKRSSTVPPMRRSKPEGYCAPRSKEPPQPPTYRSSGDPRPAVHRANWCATHLVLGQFDPTETNQFVDPTLASDVVLAASCPVLIVPNSGAFENVGRNVIVAWNGSREGSRSVRDALPILRTADRVIVCSVGPPAADHIASADAATHLARHGVSAEAVSAGDDSADVGAALLAAAADHGMDLLVMGAYGHARIREYLLGGVTRTMLRNMTLPISLSH